MTGVVETVLLVLCVFFVPLIVVAKARIYFDNLPVWEATALLIVDSLTTILRIMLDWVTVLAAEVFDIDFLLNERGRVNTCDDLTTEEILEESRAVLDWSDFCAKIARYAMRLLWVSKRKATDCRKLLAATVVAFAHRAISIAAVADNEEMVDILLVIAFVTERRVFPRANAVAATTLFTELSRVPVPLPLLCEEMFDDRKFTRSLTSEEVDAANLPIDFIKFEEVLASAVKLLETNGDRLNVARPFKLAW